MDADKALKKYCTPREWQKKVSLTPQGLIDFKGII